MDKDILVSVVIPTYSRNTTLKRAIDSVLAQTYTNIEIIVVDDNPPESEWRKSTQLIMQQYADNPKIHYVKNAQNMGGSGARNEGIKASEGEYIAFLDDDDEYFPEKVEKQLNCFLHSTQKKLALVFCDAVMTYDNDKVICYLKPRYRGCCLFEAMRDNCLAATSQWMAKKEALLNVGMFTIVPNKQDSTLILKLLEKGYEVECVEEVLSRYCTYNDERISGISEKNLAGEIRYYNACKKVFDRLCEEERKKVRFAFYERFYDSYFCLNKKTELRQLRHKMRKIDTTKTNKFLISYYIGQLKYKIRNVRSRL